MTQVTKYFLGYKLFIRLHSLANYKNIKDFLICLLTEIQKAQPMEETFLNSFLLFTPVAFIIGKYSLPIDFLELKMDIFFFISCLKLLLKFVENF